MVPSIKENFTSEKKDITDILMRIKKRDFSGNTGLAIKNGLFQFSSQIVSKLGALVLTIILARMLTPDLFGLYNLALSVILIFTTFAELGLGQTMIRFVSFHLGKKDEKTARSFYVYFRKMKLFLVLFSITALIVSANFISKVYFNKPILLALLAGVVYIIFFEIVSFVQSALQSFNYFRGIFNNEVVFEISRIVLVPLATLLVLRYTQSNEIVLMFLFIALSASYLVSSGFIYFSQLKRVNPLPLSGSKLGRNEIKDSNKFFLAASALSLSGVFFGYVDKIILGHFVSAEFIGYYSAAFNLVAALAAIIGFGTVLLPIFSRINPRQLERGIIKSLRSTLLIGLGFFAGTLIFSSVIILIIYGSAYNPAAEMLRALSPLLIIAPLVGIYSTYFMSKGKPSLLIILLLISTAVNITLSYTLVTYLLQFSESIATYGVIIAVIVSNMVYLIGLIISRRFESKKIVSGTFADNNP
ncbi:MAG: oligosaccharide flippase family protein [Nanoarchaeota archaeon]|nr:oligosaccharide flippase family protein [Nanoarchaeota archaeon]